MNFRFSYSTLNDDYDAPSAKVGEAGLQKFSSNGWFKPYLAEIPDIYYPNLIVNGVGSATFGKGGWWYQHSPELQLEWPGLEKYRQALSQGGW